MGQGNPTVSIVMPIHGTERYLESAIRSALAQTYGDFELLLLNDQSPGDPLAVIRKFDDPRLRYLEHLNAGPAFTRNRGVREGRGAFVAFLDSDDEWLPEKLAKQMRLMDERPEVDVVYTQRATIGPDGREIGEYFPRLHEGLVLQELYVDNFVCMSSSLLRRGVFETTGLIDESLRMSEDFDFWLRVAANHRFAYVDEALVRYRVHPGQVSRDVERRVRTVWEIRDNFLRTHGGRVGFRARRRARALHFSHKAYRAARSGGGLRLVLGNYLRALACWPLDGFSWRGLARTVLGAVGGKALRRVLGRKPGGPEEAA